MLPKEKTKRTSLCYILFIFFFLAAWKTNKQRHDIIEKMNRYYLNLITNEMDIKLANHFAFLHAVNTAVSR